MVCVAIATTFLLFFTGKPSPWGAVYMYHSSNKYILKWKYYGYMKNLNHLPDIVNKFVNFADIITVEVTPSQRL